MSLKKSINSLLAEKSKNRYFLPIPESVPIRNILYDWPTHEGPFKGAVDLAVALGTPVLAPLDGEVTEVVDKFDKYGVGHEFAPFLNYITIKHDHNEYSQLAHLAKGSAKIKVGETVRSGQQLAVTGLNGWMEEPFLEHVHMLVFRLLPEGKFKGLKIRWVNGPKESK